MVVSYEWEYDCDLLLKDQDCFEGVEMSFGAKGSNPAHYLHIYEDRPGFISEESKDM